MRIVSKNLQQFLTATENIFGVMGAHFPCIHG